MTLQVPVVRKYQLNLLRQTKSTEAITDAREMLKGLCLRHVDDNCSVVNGLPADEPLDSTPETMEVPGRNPAVDACRKLAETLYIKVKSCMVHIGGTFDVDDENQLMARACFAYDRQTQMQWNVVDTMDRKRRTQPHLQLPVENIKGSTTDARVTGIMTRVETKQQADDIVRWCITPRDTDDTKRTRKPISFRKSRMVV